jgi:short-subunit dehydrogenase
MSHKQITNLLLMMMTIAGSEKRTGETAIVTGGSRGIGAAVVKSLLQSDMHVIIGSISKTLLSKIHI